MVDGDEDAVDERLEKDNDVVKGKALKDVVDERVDEEAARDDAPFFFFFLNGEEDRKGESKNEPDEAKTVSFPSAVAAAAATVAVEDVTVAPDDDVHSVGDVAKLEPT